MKKRALIIGGSSGIGLATAENLLDQDVEVHVVGTNDIKLKALRTEYKGKLLAHIVDITHETQVESLRN